MSTPREKQIENIKSAQRRLRAYIDPELVIDGDFGPMTTRVFHEFADHYERLMDQLNEPRDTMPSLPGEIDTHRPASIHERALHWCLDESEDHAGQRVHADRVAEYFEGCERDGKNIGGWLAGEVRSGKHYSFCAAAQGFAEAQVACDGESRAPHRAGALEVMRDAQSGARPGERWVDVGSFISKREVPPPPGSLAIYTRNGPPGSGHIERVIYADWTGFRSIGANEDGGRWVIDDRLQPYSKDGLLGFIVPDRVP